MTSSSSSPTAHARTLDANSFDLAYSLATFEHIHDLPGVLSEIRRVLKPGGQLITVGPIRRRKPTATLKPTTLSPARRSNSTGALIFGKARLAEYLVAGEGFTPQEARDAVAFIFDVPPAQFPHSG